MGSRSFRSVPPLVVLSPRRRQRSDEGLSVSQDEAGSGTTVVPWKTTFEGRHGSQPQTQLRA